MLVMAFSALKEGSLRPGAFDRGAELRVHQAVEAQFIEGCIAVNLRGRLAGD